MKVRNRKALLLAAMLVAGAAIAVTVNIDARIAP